MITAFAEDVLFTFPMQTLDHPLLLQFMQYIFVPDALNTLVIILSKQDFGLMVTDVSVLYKQIF